MISWNVFHKCRKAFLKRMAAPDNISTGLRSANLKFKLHITGSSSCDHLHDPKLESSCARRETPAAVADTDNEGAWLLPLAHRCSHQSDTPADALTSPCAPDDALCGHCLNQEETLPSPRQPMSILDSFVY